MHFYPIDLQVQLFTITVHRINTCSRDSPRNLYLGTLINQIRLLIYWKLFPQSWDAYDAKGMQ